MRQLLTAFLVASLPSVVHAGDFGAVSRASVGISITIPPRVEVTRVEARQAGSPHGVCVSAIGAGEHTVTISTISTAAGDDALVRLPITDTGCAEGDSARRPISTLLDLSQRTTNGRQLMLLIAPE